MWHLNGSRERHRNVGVAWNQLVPNLFPSPSRDQSLRWSPAIGRFPRSIPSRTGNVRPGDRRVILKFTDLHQEAAIMAALRRMNECWRALDIRAARADNG